MFLDRSKYRFSLSLVLSFCLLLFLSGVSLAAPSNVGSYAPTGYGIERNGDNIYLVPIFGTSSIIHEKCLVLAELLWTFQFQGFSGSFEMLTSGGWVTLINQSSVYTGNGNFTTHIAAFVDTVSTINFRIVASTGSVSNVSLSSAAANRKLYFVPVPEAALSEQEMTTFINNVNSSLTTINNNINNVSNSVANLPSDFGNVLEQSNEQVYGSDDADVDSALDDLLRDMQEHLGFVGDLVVMPITILNQLMTGSASATVSAGTLNLLGASAPISFDFTFLDSLQPYFYTMTTAVCGFVLWQTLKDAYSYLFGVDV